METRQSIRIMIRAYAAILFILGCLGVALAIVGFALAFGPLESYANWMFSFAYQLAKWGIIQLLSGLFLFLISRRLLSFILAKESEGQR